MKALLLALLISVNSQASFTGDYEGTSDGEQYKMTLTQTGDQLTGSAEGGGIKFSISGKVSGRKASGDLSIEGFKLKFEADLTAEGVTLKLLDEEGSETIVFKRKAGTAPAPQPSGVLAKFKKEPSATLKGGKEYVHASGGKLRYPGTWKLEELEGMLRLTPPDAGEREVYLVIAEPANGATDPNKPEILAYLDEQVLASIPFVKRTGKPEPSAAGGGKGVVLTWEGESNGKVLVRGYITILKGYGISLVAAGPKDVIEKRDAQLREIFQTFGWGQGQVDSRLVGSWTHWSYSGGSSLARETKAAATLRADGTFDYKSDTETSGSAKGTNQYGDITWTGGLAGRSGSGWKGRWTASGGTLILNFEDGTSEVFSYRFKQEGANTFLVIKPEGGKETEWSRSG